MLYIEAADFAPQLVALRIEENECRRVFEVVNRLQLVTSFALNVDVDNVDFIAQFLFQPVHDGFCCGAVNSVGRLKFEQDRFATTDHLLDSFGVCHQGRLPRMQNNPGYHQAGHNRAERNEVPPFRLMCE